MFDLCSFKFVPHLVFPEELNENPKGALVTGISESYLDTGLQETEDSRAKEESTEPSRRGLSTILKAMLQRYRWTCKI